MNELTAEMPTILAHYWQTFRFENRAAQASVSGFHDVRAMSSRETARRSDCRSAGAAGQGLAHRPEGGQS